MTDKELIGNSEQLDCSDCVNHGGDYELAALISKIRSVDERLKDTLETCIKA